MGNGILEKLKYQAELTNLWARGFNVLPKWQKIKEAKIIVSKVKPDPATMDYRPCVICGIRKAEYEGGCWECHNVL